jgi:hypothetical protein
MGIFDPGDAVPLSELAKRHPGPVGNAYKFLSDGPNGSMESNTKLVGHAFQTLLQWALGGVKGSLDAYHTCVGKLPREKYQVAYDAAQISAMERQLDKVDSELRKTREEVDRDLKRVRSTNPTGNANEVRFERQRLDEWVKAYTAHHKEISERCYMFDSEARKLEFRKMIPLKKS